jgi:hypothetical protein
MNRNTRLKLCEVIARPGLHGRRIRGGQTNVRTQNVSSWKNGGQVFIVEMPILQKISSKLEKGATMKVIIFTVNIR